MRASRGAGPPVRRRPSSCNHYLAIIRHLAASRFRVRANVSLATSKSLRLASDSELAANSQPGPQAGSWRPGPRAGLSSEGRQWRHTRPAGIRLRCRFSLSRDSSLRLSCCSDLVRVTQDSIMMMILVGRRFAAALVPRLFGKNPRSHHKGATGRVRTGDQRLVLSRPVIVVRRPAG